MSKNWVEKQASDLIRQVIDKERKIALKHKQDIQLHSQQEKCKFR